MTRDEMLTELSVLYERFKNGMGWRDGNYEEALDMAIEILEAEQTEPIPHDDYVETGNDYVKRKMEEVDAPTIDAVEVVRCKDCEHRYMGNLNVWECTFGLMIIPDGFCNYGERRKSDELVQ